MFPPEREHGAHNLQALLEKEGFSAWVLYEGEEVQGPEPVGVFVEAAAVRRAIERAGYLRALHGVDFSFANKPRPSFFSRSVLFFFAVGFPILLIGVGIYSLLYEGTDGTEWVGILFCTAWAFGGYRFIRLNELG